MVQEIVDWKPELRSFHHGVAGVLTEVWAMDPVASMSGGLMQRAHDKLFLWRLRLSGERISTIRLIPGKTNLSCLWGSTHALHMFCLKLSVLVFTELHLYFRAEFKYHFTRKSSLEPLRLPAPSVLPSLNPLIFYISTYVMLVSSSISVLLACKVHKAKTTSVLFMALLPSPVPKHSRDPKILLNK